MRKKEITKQERLQLIGLVEIARQHYEKMNEADEAMVEILGAGKDYERAGLLSDEYFENKPNVDKCLKLMGIKVKK